MTGKDMTMVVMRRETAGMTATAMAGVGIGRPRFTGNGRMSRRRSTMPRLPSRESGSFYHRYLIVVERADVMDKRTEYVESLSAQMVEWDAQIDLLKDKVESAAPEAK